MEKRLSPAPPSYDKRKRLSDPVLLLLGIGLASLTAIDVYIHSQGGISDPEKRAEMVSIFGKTLIDHIGNFGLAAAPTIVVTAGKKILEHTDTMPSETTIYDHLVKHGYHLTIAGLMASIMLVEGFPDNNHLIKDLLMSGVGIAMAISATEETLHRFRVGKSRNVYSRPDPMFRLKNIPTSVDHHKYLNKIPTSVDKLFSSK